MITHAGKKQDRRAAPDQLIAPNASLTELRAQAQLCRGCDIWQRATQVVFGEGRPGAEVMLVGEQPGNSEDLDGRPFVGPAGRLLDEALARAGIMRDRVLRHQHRQTFQLDTTRKAQDSQKAERAGNRSLPPLVGRRNQSGQAKGYCLSRRDGRTSSDIKEIFGFAAARGIAEIYSRSSDYCDSSSFVDLAGARRGIAARGNGPLRRGSQKDRAPSSLLGSERRVGYTMGNSAISVVAIDRPALREDAVMAAAKAAHLRYVTDRQPGITRERTNDGFVYRNSQGSTINDRGELARIRAIAVPPAWTAVWICPHRNGHIQATGRDSRGRRQYRYHSQWRSVRDETKFEHMLVFGRALSEIRRRVEADLAKPGLPREKVLAAVVRLMER